jgi:NADH:ubiquinone oxidoreductase subunit 6 (subunit J)
VVFQLCVLGSRLMVDYWYAFLVPGVLLLVAAVVTQLFNMRNFLAGGGDVFAAVADTEDPNVAFARSLASVKSTGRRLFGGLLVVGVCAVLGAILTMVGVIALVGYLVR